MNDFRVVLITAPDMDEAERIAETLVGEQLAACVNIVPGVRSVYLWKGTLERDDEVLLVAKTSRERFDRLRDRVEEIHSYDVPEVIALDLDAASGAYASFLSAALGGSDD